MHPANAISKKEKRRIKDSLQHFVSSKITTNLIGEVTGRVLDVKRDEFVLLGFKTCVPKIHEFGEKEQEEFVEELWKASQYCKLERSDAVIYTLGAPDPSELMVIKIYNKSEDVFQLTFKPTQQKVDGRFYIVQTSDDPIRVMAGFVLVI